MLIVATVIKNLHKVASFVRQRIAHAWYPLLMFSKDLRPILATLTVFGYLGWS